MPDISNFSYRFGTSFLHNLDVRFKLMCFVIISVGLLRIYLTGLFVLMIALTALIIYSNLSFISVLKELRYFFILLMFVCIARMLSTPGTPIIEIRFLTITREGLHDGILVCWRMFLIVLCGLLFASTTRSSEIRAAVEWFLKPFPFIPRKRVAVMLSLIIRFIPVILDQAKEISDAQRARGIENRKNPVYRLIKFGIPLLRRTFERADELVAAMEARCYSENRTEPVPVSDKKDWAALFAVICLCAALIFVQMG